MAFCPKNPALLATASDDTRIRLTNILLGKNSKTLGTGYDKHKDSLNSLAFSCCGKILISSACDKFIKLWDVEKLKLITVRSKESNNSPVDKVAFYPNTFDFATNSYTENITLWGGSQDSTITETNIKLD